MRVVMEIQRRGTRYEGSLTREGDELCLPFAGMLELMAALERLEPDEADAVFRERTDDGSRS
ncbi:MAG: hypothetical protein QOK02_3800 [Mycobacterium sp.]|jgi:hypothetical protein|nr:hypothetical protein [Mycobacterium sp.]